METPEDTYSGLVTPPCICTIILYLNQWIGVVWAKYQTVKSRGRENALTFYCTVTGSQKFGTLVAPSLGGDDKVTSR